jgi:hypothetical protein
MKYSLVIEPFETEDEVVEKAFESENDVEAKIYMCFLFYGFNSLEEMYEEFEYNLRYSSKEVFLDFLLKYLESVNGKEDLDYFKSLLNTDTGDLIWYSKNDKEEMSFEV